MPAVLSPKERDQAVLALRDIQGLLQHARKAEFQDLDEVQKILATRGLQIAPIPKPQALTLPDVPAPATVAVATPKITPEERWKLEQHVQMYRAFKAQALTNSYVYKLGPVGDLLVIACKQADIEFKK